MSGDCRFTRKLRRGFVGFPKRHQVPSIPPKFTHTHTHIIQACVRRRAVESVAAERAVNEVWESCFSDTRFFDEVCVCAFFGEKMECSNVLLHRGS